MRANEFINDTLEEGWKKGAAAALAAGAIAGVPLTQYMSNKFNLGLYDTANQGREHVATQKFEPEYAKSPKFYAK